MPPWALAVEAADPSLRPKVWAVPICHYVNGLAFPVSCFTVFRKHVVENPFGKSVSRFGSRAKVGTSRLDRRASALRRLRLLIILYHSISLIVHSIILYGFSLVYHIMLYSFRAEGT